MRNERNKERALQPCGEVTVNGEMSSSHDKSRSKRIVCVDGDLLLVLRDFIAAFETVFHKDWIFTQYRIMEFCHPETFLQPGENSEAEGWVNHTDLLRLYDDLKAELAKKQFKVLPVECSDERRARVLAYIEAKLS
jgi:hypothetical protein